MYYDNATEPRYKAMYITEFIGVFILVLVIQFAGSSNFGIFAIFFAFLLAITIAAPISGANLNGSVTYTCYLLNEHLENKEPPKKFYYYILSQIAGGTSAGILYYLLHGSDGLANLSLGVGTSGIQGFFYEMIYNFFLNLMVTILCDPNYKHTQAPLIGLLVGGIVLVEAIAIGNFTGGCINPSIATSILLVRGFATDLGKELGKLPLYILAHFSGAYIAYTVYMKYIRQFFASIDAK